VPWSICRLGRISCVMPVRIITDACASERLQDYDERNLRFSLDASHRHTLSARSTPRLCGCDGTVAGTALCAPWRAQGMVCSRILGSFMFAAYDGAKFDWSYSTCQVGIPLCSDNVARRATQYIDAQMHWQVTPMSHRKEADSCIHGWPDRVAPCSGRMLEVMRIRTSEMVVEFVSAIMRLSM